MIAYTILTDPQNIFRDISSRALITRILASEMDYAPVTSNLRIVNPGRITTTPADEIAL